MVDSNSDAPNRPAAGARSAQESCSPVPGRAPKVAPRNDYCSRSTADCGFVARHSSRSTHHEPPFSKPVRTTTDRPAPLLPSGWIAPDNADWLPPAHGTASSDGARSVPSTTDWLDPFPRLRTPAVQTPPQCLPLWPAAHWLHSAGFAVAHVAQSFALRAAATIPDRVSAPAADGIPGLSIFRWPASSPTAHRWCGPFL